MDTLEIIMNGETERALNQLIDETKAKNANDDLKKLQLLKANLKKTKRDNRLGLITQEEYGVVFAKTNQYLIDFVREEKLEIDTAAIKPKFKSIVRQIFMFVSILGVIIGLLFFYLRRDILEQIITEQHFDESYLLLFPTLLLAGSIYLFIKTRKHA